MVELVNLVKIGREKLGLRINASKKESRAGGSDHVPSSFYCSERIRKRQSFSIFRLQQRNRWRLVDRNTVAMTRLRNVKCNKRTLERRGRSLYDHWFCLFSNNGAETLALKPDDKRKSTPFRCAEDTLDSVMNQHFNRQRNIGISQVKYFMRETHSRGLDT